ncbi:MAG: helix-turn-helix transcriptional regulator [Ahrensia sp.]|nr:helix-turn-helix transcriptional regulator [Ahrensia sp.]
MDDKNPDPIDVHVGKRVRMQRMVLKMSQEALGDKLGVTFQQIQKYEKATNRISASKLYQIASALNVQVAFFYQDAPIAANEARGLSEADGPAYETDFYSTPESLKLNLAFKRIGSPSLRRRTVDLVKAMADEFEETSE